VRRRRVTVALDEDEHGELRARARAHGVSISELVRSTLCRRPSGRSQVAAADAWRDALPPTRRDQVYRWLAQGGHTPEGPIPGQLTITTQ
jgi:plasmid stability protein